MATCVHFDISMNTVGLYFASTVFLYGLIRFIIGYRIGQFIDEDKLGKYVWRPSSLNKIYINMLSKNERAYFFKNRPNLLVWHKTQKVMFYLTLLHIVHIVLILILCWLEYVLRFYTI